jgi:hypothetical protein
MVNFPGRNGRRRRVLNEEVLAASAGRSTVRLATEESNAHQPLRYSEAAGVENHPQITDFIPRRYRTIALLVVAGAATTAGLAALDYATPKLAHALGVAAMPPFDLAARGSLAAWIAAVVLLAASALCLLVYSVRRHRIDDYRGRYRIWLAASAASLVLSANSVAGMHHVVAHAMSQATGWTLLRGGAIWWLAAAGLPIAWITLRTLRDMLECRLAAALWVAAIVCYLAAAACYLGAGPQWGPQIRPIVDAVLRLFGHWLALAAVVSYARYVVLDAQGLIPARAPSTNRKTTARPHRPAAPKPSSPDGAATLPLAPRMEPAAASAAWIDGSRPEPDPYDDDGDDDAPGDSRKLSKADRKRLRKLKAQNRAA